MVCTLSFSHSVKLVVLEGSDTVEICVRPMDYANPGGLQRDFIDFEGLLRDHMDYEKWLRDFMDSKCKC